MTVTAAVMGGADFSLRAFLNKGRRMLLQLRGRECVWEAIAQRTDLVMALANEIHRQWAHCDAVVATLVESLALVLTHVPVTPWLCGAMAPLLVQLNQRAEQQVPPSLDGKWEVRVSGRIAVDKRLCSSSEGTLARRARWAKFQQSPSHLHPFGGLCLHGSF